MATFTQYVEAKNKNLKDLSNEEIYYLLLESLTQLEETGDGVCFQVKSPLIKKNF